MAAIDTPRFEWSPEYDTILTKIAESEQIQVDWPKLRHIITHKVNQNVSVYLDLPIPDPSLPTPTFTAHATSTGGLKLPPFPPRKKKTELPINYMTAEKANEFKGFVLSQLNEFEANPPFTIQRVCELCVMPQKHYKSVGKYLRALEKSLLVTSTLDSFPPLSEDQMIPAGGSTLVAASTPMSSNSVPMELFSPIPFLHDDARRSKSRSPPPSPLSSLVQGSIAQMESIKSAKTPALGLVDELDSPNPEHMSDHPVALTSTTTTLPTLEDRFVKSDDASTEASKDSSMVVESSGTDGGKPS